jgi:uncharacterized protein (DUF1501 family)
MKINQLESMARRAFMRRAGQLSLAGVATPWALNLAAIGEAAAFEANDYKALVCVFLYGGNDHNNTIVPFDMANFKEYERIRVGIATPHNSLEKTVLAPVNPLPNGMQLALAPELFPLKEYFDSGKLAIQLNVGTLIEPTTLAQYKARSTQLPPKLFSHNDQASLWQSGQSEGAIRGWGGRMGDLALAGNGQSAFGCISVTGNAVYLAGERAIPYQVSSKGAIAIAGLKSPLFGSRACSTALSSIITQPTSHLIENELSQVASRSINSESMISSALSNAGNLRTAFDPVNSLAQQLKTVAKLIASRATLGVKRQVFMVGLGGFDTHAFLSDVHPKQLTKLGDALKSFYKATEELGVSNNVTTFTASDFGRTLASNGDGSDHGWGSHHFVLGGAVKGQQFYGTAPQISVNGPDDVGAGRLLPTTSVDQLSATLASWFGVSDSELSLIAPNVKNFNVKNLGFV